MNQMQQALNRARATLLGPRRNKFELAAHNLEVTRKGQRPSFPNTWPEGVRE